MQQNNAGLDLTQLMELLNQNSIGGFEGIGADTNQGFGFNSGTLSNIGTGASILGDLAGLYFGNKQLKQAENQFATNTAFGNRNLANQAKVINNTLEARYRAALAAQGVDPNTGGRGTGGTQRESLNSYLARSKVDGSPVGGG